MRTKTIKQTATFKASPHEIYELLMDSKKHSGFTQAPAKISKKVNGKFTTYGNYIDGVNLELVKDKKIVQSWHGSEWPKDHYSKATFLLKKNKNGTKLIFTQSNVPVEFYKDISEGWMEHYWNKMKSYLKE